MRGAYYNEFDPFAAAWLRELIKDNLIAPGEVDTRSIEDVSPDDLRSFAQCHFFAGIGVWSAALRRAGWEDSRAIWTGSCPCQPFSAAGKGGGFADERHLWPAFFHLIEQCRPDVVAGEQVASKDGLAWLDLVQTDLERAGYAFGAVDTCAAGFGAPHIRQRLYWVGARLEHAASDGRIERRAESSGRGAAGRCGDGRMADTDGAGQRSSAIAGFHDEEHNVEPRRGAVSGLGSPSPTRLQERVGNAGISGRPIGADAREAVVGAGVHAGRMAHTEHSQRRPEREVLSETHGGMDLEGAVTLAGPARLTASGQLLTGSDAGMESGGQLSPAHSLWLMLGPFATAWLNCAERVTRSTSRKPKASSKRSISLSDALE